MSPSDEQPSRRPGMPERSAVVSEKILTPERRSTQAPEASASETTTYRILRTSETDPYDVPLQPAEVATLGLERFAGFGDAFRGNARKAAKLTIADAGVEAFEDIKDLIETLPTEEGMISHQPPITTDAASDRVDEENRNVHVNGVLGSSPPALCIATVLHRAVFLCTKQGEAPFIHKIRDSGPLTKRSNDAGTDRGEAAGSSG
jgi:hypothetical protein